MNPSVLPVAGSPLWQLVFVSFAVVLILFEVLRGWRRGVARQIARLGALVAAYFAAYFGGPLVVPLLRPFLTLPDIALSILAGAVLALVIYGVINALGTIFFRRTSQHDSTMVRLFCGAGGSVLGIFFGVFLIWLVVVGVRTVGSIANAQAQQRSPSAGSANAEAIHAVDVRRGTVGEPDQESTALVSSLARLKSSIEMGAIGDVVKRTDLTPAVVYDSLGKIGQVAGNPQIAERFLAFPGANKLTENPKIVALRNDPEITTMIAQGRYFDLLQNEKIIDAANDPQLVELVKKFDFHAALDYALKRE